MRVVEVRSESQAPDLQRRILAAQAAKEFVTDVLRAPWWLLDVRGHAGLVEVFTWCSPVCLLRSASACHAWHRAAESREAWRFLRLSFGWGPDFEMRCLLRRLKRLGQRHGLMELPEVAPSSPASTPSSPGTACEGYPPSSPPQSPVQAAKGAQPSQLLLCRHPLGNALGELWLLQLQSSRCQDPARRALSRLLAAQPQLLANHAVLEVNAGAGLVGLGSSAYAKTMTITAPDDLTCRLIRLNASLLGKGKSRPQVPGLSGMSVPVYVYTLPISLNGAKALARQWHKSAELSKRPTRLVMLHASLQDSGSAMRALKPSLLAPSFDVILHAGEPLDVQGLMEMCQHLLAPAGLLVTVCGALDDVSAMYCAVKAKGFAFEKDEVIHDPQEGYFRDGSNFSFYVRCFNVEEDIPMIREMTNGKRLLMISDIRGVALTDDEHFDKVQDQEVQWQAIQALQPESSLVKFALPHVWEQFYDYAPGVLLKQTFCNFGTLELRLLVSGVPAKRYSYDGWDIVEKMTFHHEHLRGQVYSSGLRPKCLDGCFDCSVLMERLELASITDSLLKFHVYYCSGGEEWEKFSWIPPSIIERWQVVLWGLKRGNLSEAILALEVEAKEGEEDLDACLAGFMVPHHSS
eukprot:g15078.t2